MSVVLGFVLSGLLAGQDVLPGRSWRQISATGTCRGARKVRSLSFDGRGGYELYFNERIETITEESGTYEWDPATEAFQLSGRKGRARIVDGALVIEGMLLDRTLEPWPVPAPQKRLTRAEQAAGCISTFQRRQ